MGRNKGFKKIHIPLLGNNGGEIVEQRSANVQTYMLQIYVHEPHVGREEVVREIVNSKLKLI